MGGFFVELDCLYEIKIDSVSLIYVFGTSYNEVDTCEVFYRDEWNVDAV